MKLTIITIAICLIVSSCSRKSAKDLYAEASAAYENRDFHGAIALFEQVVAREQSSAYAESSQYRIALVYNNDLHDARHSLSAYDAFRRLFPSSKQAPTALFLMGFLYNNETHQLDSAKLIYERFLAEYPDHELAKSARFELESLGRDPMRELDSRVTTVEQPAAKKKK